MNRYLAYGMTCVLLLLALSAGATTIVMPTDDQLIAKSPVILEGTVVSVTPAERNGAVWTDTVIEVSRNIKGDTAPTVTVSEIGGELGDHITKVYGSPEFGNGEQVLMFLERSPFGGYRTIDLFVGKFTEDETVDGTRVWMRNDVTADVVLLDADFQPIHAKNVQREAAPFENFIYDRLGGRDGLRNYGMENPVLRRSVNLDPRQVEANFTLISEPTVYRWTGFDSGQTAKWYSNGTQPGYTDGGVTELRNGMGAWTGYASANINYSYAGSYNGPLGGLHSTNGVNEVLFNDPLNEISGTYNPATGGVVGQGGFNGVSGSSSWTAPFTADGSHTAGTKTAWKITEANLTIQDGVTPTAHISSTVLAEIIAHEFGHTLGLGHSADSTALMYATVTGRGPSLRTDDQLAARWLYPNGGGAPPPPVTVPAAPSNLSATPGSNYLDLRWTDNATDETGQSVYLSANNGSFSKVADVGANATSTRLSGLSANSYRVYVIAWNSAGNSAASNTASATISTTLTASFAVSPASGTAGVTNFSFYDQSQGSVASRSWSFGDGATSTAATATHMYQQAGTYTVTLKVTSTTGQTAQTSKSVSVTAQVQPLVAAFNWSPVSPTTNDTVTFLDASTGGVTSWSWTFGDGSTSTAQNPSKRYAAQGTYSVTLTVHRNADVNSVSHTVTVAAPAPVTQPVAASFSASTSTAAVGTGITFTDQSTGAPTRWAWNFGDGGTSSAQNPVHAYGSAGAYTVTLVASNATSSSTSYGQVTITSMEPYRTLISVSAQTGGLNGTSWRTELSLYNAGAQGANISLTFLPGAGGTVLSRSLFLSPRQSITYANTLYDVFGISSGSGALAIEATSAGTSAMLKVSSRTYTSGATGTYGQAVPDVRPDDLQRTVYLTGIASNAAFRTNIGLANRSASPVSATLTLVDKSGAAVGSTSVTIAANNFQQAALTNYFPTVANRAYDVLSMKVTSTAATLSAYASVVDNASQDPIYIQAVTPEVGSSAMIPVVGRSGGVNGTFWRSDVTLYNPNVSRMAVTFRYAAGAKTVYVDSGDTTVLADIVSQLGQTGTGPLQVSWTGTTWGPVLTTRTYTTATTGGTFGQSIDPVAAFGTDMIVPGLRNDAGFRSNLGVVNGGTETETVEVSVLSAAGTQMGSTRITLAPGALIQSAANQMFPSVSGGFTLRVHGDANAKIFAYGSMVDNGTGDPVFFAGQ